MFQCWILQGLQVQVVIPNTKRDEASYKKQNVQEHTQGWLDWSKVHLARNTADAATIDGMKFRKPLSINVSSAR